MTSKINIEKLIRWYKSGLWTEKMIQEALNKGIISEKDYGLIINSK